MSLVYDRHGVSVHHGEALDVLRTMPDASVDAVVTDPPYGLSDLRSEAVVSALTAWANGDRERVPAGNGFMGRKWDAFVPPPAVWDECLRVLRPGGHLAAFAGSRTAGLMDLSIRMAGFEIRDGLQWLHGQGFPKGVDVGKAIDKANGKHDRDLGPLRAHIAECRQRAGLSRADVSEAIVGTRSGACWNWENGNPPSVDNYLRLCELLQMGPVFLELVQWCEAQRAVIGQWSMPGRGSRSTEQAYGLVNDSGDITAPATDAARQWQGWNTSLRPSFEPIILARKPLSGTVAQTVLAHGTGALNIGACRTAHADAADLAGSQAKNPGRGDVTTSDVYGVDRPQQSVNVAGRWPANVLLSHAPLLDEHGQPVGDACAESCVPGCAVAELNGQSGVSTSPGTYNRGSVVENHVYGASNERPVQYGHGDTGAASRFFPTFRWEAKAPTSERPQVNGVSHPTTKPLSLIRWLCRLLTPPGGLVVDCFAGSGTTGHAARAEGMQAVLVEREADYIPLIRARLDARERTPATSTGEVSGDEPMDLLDLLDFGDAS